MYILSSRRSYDASQNHLSKNPRNRQFTSEVGMSSSQHLDLAAEGWFKMPLIEQMANIGSEVSRAIRARNNQSRYWGAVTRALELFYLTVEDTRWKRGQLKEILRVRELFCAAVLESTEFNTSLEDLDEYFTYFALLTQANRRQVS